MIIDCFIFFNELDLLEYRLNILNNIIDFFIIVESTKTFTGNDKPLFFNDNKNKFKHFNYKIIHIIVTDFIIPDISKNQQWINEKIQRNYINNGIISLHQNFNILDNDLIIISDVDEIPDPNTLSYIKNFKLPITIASLGQDLYYYNLKCKNKLRWNRAKILSYHFYKKFINSKPNICRIINPKHCISKGGWHLSYFGDYNFIKNKIINFSHQEVNKNEFINNDTLINNIIHGKDLFNRSDQIFDIININDNKYLPPLYNIFLSKFL
jgi:beta-1,4-mannosyl-glycoprotein beta-1,4-N-acetylglucosaminyltransferase